MQIYTVKRVDFSKFSQKKGSPAFSHKKAGVGEIEVVLKMEDITDPF